ncbi:MAG: glycosyltransferase [Rubricoccaceae bacterium]|nr:glycosyltransferase [Rubricoccaceae bacterium]
MVSPAHPSYADIRVFQKEARTLAANGYEVTLYARADSQPSSFIEDGVRVVPVQYSTRGGMLLATPSLLRKLLAESADLYHLHNPFSLPLVVALKLAGRKVIYDVHEDFRRRVHLRAWIPRMIRTQTGIGIAIAERIAGRLVDAGIASQPNVVRRLGKKAVLLLNAPVVGGDLIDNALAFAETLSEEEVHPEGALRLAYIGGLSGPRGLFEMTELVARLNEDVPARLWLLGYSDPDDLEAARRQPGWRFVDYLGRQPQTEAFGRVARADIALAVLRDQGGHADASPNKLYEYMALGTPFVASDFPFWREGLPVKSGGLFVDPEDMEAIVKAVEWLVQNPEETQRLTSRGNQYVREYFNWSHESQTLLALYERLLA